MLKFCKDLSNYLPVILSPIKYYEFMKILSGLKIELNNQVLQEEISDKVQ